MNKPQQGQQQRQITTSDWVDLPNENEVCYVDHGDDQPYFAVWDGQEFGNHWPDGWQPLHGVTRWARVQLQDKHKKPNATTA